MANNDLPNLSACIPRIHPDDVRRMREANTEFASRMEAFVEVTKPAAERMGRDIGAFFHGLTRRS